MSVFSRSTAAIDRRCQTTCLLVAALALPGTAVAQIRERPVSFDSAGTVDVITPPLAARLGLAAPVWPVTGDYLDARLYALGDSAAGFVLVARRPGGLLERYMVDAEARALLAGAIARGVRQAPTRMAGDSSPTVVSEPVRGLFVLNQTVLAAVLFGPTAAALTSDGSVGAAVYLLVTGGTFFAAANFTKSRPVSRAQNHLSFHSARRGAIAANLLLYAAAGENADGTTVSAVTLLGGIAGDVAGFRIARPMTDAEAHGTSHGSTVTALVTTGVLGTAGMFEEESKGRAAAAVIMGAGALGYPLGLRYVRRVPYRVTAGDVGTLETTGMLGIAAASVAVADSDLDEPAAFGIFTAGYLAGVVAGERLLVRKYDHTEGEARLLMVGTVAGGLMGLAIPVLGSADNASFVLGSMTAGGVIGAILTERLLEPRRAAPRREATQPSRGGAAQRRSGIDVQFSPTGALLAATGRKGSYPLVMIGF